jgi:hypothetical protein
VKGVFTRPGPEPDVPVATLAALEMFLRVADFTALEIQIARFVKFIVEYFVANPPVL